MGKCQKPDCKKEATKTVYRLPTDEERELMPFVAIAELDVCEEHLEAAQKMYPYVKDEEIYS